MEKEDRRGSGDYGVETLDVSLDGLDVSSGGDPSELSGNICLENTRAAAVLSGDADTADREGKRLLEDSANSDVQGNQIAELLQRTGYSIVQANGQRHYGPPPSWEGPPPQRGCEVFVGKIPRDCYEDELVPVFEKVGKIYEMRLMLDHYSGQNRGYCFVVFSSPLEAKQCVRVLNNYEIRKGRSLGICMSVDNCRLFVGGIPKKVTKEDILTEMQKVTEGVVDVIVYPSASDKSKNRGFAFVEYESHRAAAMARRKLINGRVDLWGHNIAVDWAEPELEVDADIMAQVKVLYVRNLMLSTTEAHILDVFSAYGCVERVKKIKDYAFVHFQNREEAHKAIEGINGTMLDGAQVEVTLAKPVDKDTYLRSPKAAAKAFNVSALYVPVDQYGTLMCISPTGYFSPPSTQRFMLRNSMGACMLPTSPRIARPASPVGIRGQVGPILYPMTFAPGSGAQGRVLYPGSPVRPPTLVQPFYQPASPQQTFFEQPVNKRMSEQEFSVAATGPLPAHPGAATAAAQATMMEVPVATPPVMAPPTTATKSNKSSGMLLEELCQKNNWSCPIYSLHTSSSSVGPGEGDTLFLYKVTIGCLGLTYVPPKMSRSLAEAREISAEHALMQLGCPVEAAAGAFVPPPRGAYGAADLPPHLHPGVYTHTHGGYVTYAASPAKPQPVCSWPQPLSPMDHTSPAYYTSFSENPYPTPQQYPEYYHPAF